MFVCVTPRHFYLNLNFNQLWFNIFSIRIILISPRGAISEYKMTYLFQMSPEGLLFGCVYYEYLLDSFLLIETVPPSKGLCSKCQILIEGYGSWFLCQVSSTHTSACRAPSPRWPSASWRSTPSGTTARPWPSPNSGLPPRLLMPPWGPPGWPVARSRLP